MSQNPQIEAKAYRAFHEELSRHIVHGDDAYQAAIRAYLASQEAVAPSEEPHSDFAVARDAVWRSLETVRQAALASPAVAPVAQSEPADLIERLRGPVFGTQTALDAATAIETWKARAERLADMHRDMCVVAGEAVARAETAEAALASRTAPVAVSVKGLCDCERSHNGIGATGRECDCPHSDDLTDCFRHHVLTTIGWLPFGARPGNEQQMYEDGFKAGYRRCKADNEQELGEEEAIATTAARLHSELEQRTGHWLDEVKLRKALVAALKDLVDYFKGAAGDPDIFPEEDRVLRAGIAAIEQAEVQS